MKRSFSRSLTSFLIDAFDAYWILKQRCTLHARRCTNLKKIRIFKTLSRVYKLYTDVTLSSLEGGKVLLFRTALGLHRWLNY